MKKQFYLLGLLLFPCFMQAQNVGIGTTTPHPNAILDISGINKGLLIPRGDAATRTILNANTAKGLLMYDTITSNIWVHNGINGWEFLSIGRNYWVQNGALGTEIKNTNTGGLWSANFATVNTDPGLINPPVSGAGTRFMWMPLKSAFRAGTVLSTEWDAANIGVWSFASGRSTLASGSSSTAMGDSSVASGIISFAAGGVDTASGIYSTAFGNRTNATGSTSIATGYNTRASGQNSTAMGANTSASQYASTAIGNLTKATGIASTAMGNITFATGSVSTAMGSNTNASGSTSTAMGFFTDASGDASTALGDNTVSKAYSSVALGRYNDSITTSSKTTWVTTDPLLILGNGTSDADRHNAMVVYKNGNLVLKNPTTVINTTTAFFSTVPINDAGTRMMWLPEKGAFRAGTVTGGRWNGDSMGIWSFAAGYNTKAYHNASSAFGYNTQATGFASSVFGVSSEAEGYFTFATGENCYAHGVSSVAMGHSAKSIGNTSFSMGSNTKAEGNVSYAFGYNVITKSRNEFVIGQFNDTLLSTTPVSHIWNYDEALLVLGNGSSDADRRNAMVVYKNGNTGIGTNTPGTNKLDVNGNTQTDSLQVGSGTKFSKMQAGTLAAGGSAAQFKQVTIFFLTPFLTTPKIMVTPRNDPANNNNDVYAVTVRSISTTSAVINILRVDVAAGWGQNLQLDWHAWTQ